MLIIALNAMATRGILYFLLILPEKKRTKKYNEMLSALEKNDEIVTRGGIMGKII
ncbi:MAG: preprotein translocase subunit YajC, partial [Staphylococcus epidermidis]|nr:preprotein translocase subunit YajC [Staphylococcus epidermidis]